MSVGSVNSPLSLQESQLLQILQQQSAFRTKAQGSAQDTDKTGTKTGQNLPGGTDVQGSDTNLDPELSPDKISALLLALQTQQASLDTTLLMGGAGTGNGGNSLVDYLTSDSDTDNPFGTVDDSGNGSGSDGSSSLSLADYLS
jgi:hypothetical protein